RQARARGFAPTGSPASAAPPSLCPEEPAECSTPWKVRGRLPLMNRNGCTGGEPRGRGPLTGWRGGGRRASRPLLRAGRHGCGRRRAGGDRNGAGAYPLRPGVARPPGECSQAVERREGPPSNRGDVPRGGTFVGTAVPFRRRPATGPGKGVRADGLLGPYDP